MENLKDSIESFGFRYAGNKIYLEETVMPLISTLSEAFEQIGIVEVPNKKTTDPKNDTYALNTGNDFFTQIIITLNEHEILRDWLINKMLDLTVNKIAKLFVSNEKIKEKIFISFIKSNKEITVKLSAEGIDKEDLNSIVHNIMKELSN